MSFRKIRVQFQRSERSAASRRLSRTESNRPPNAPLDPTAGKRSVGLGKVQLEDANGLLIPLNRLRKIVLITPFFVIPTLKIELLRRWSDLPRARKALDFGRRHFRLYAGSDRPCSFPVENFVQIKFVISRPDLHPG